MRFFEAFFTENEIKQIYRKFDDLFNYSDYEAILKMLINFSWKIQFKIKLI